MNVFVCVQCSEVWESREPARNGVRCDKCKGNKDIMKQKEYTYEWIIKHIKEIDNTVNELRKQSLDRTDSYCSLMQAKSMALLALSHTPPYQK